jgi:hypothetical protein
MKRQNYFAVTHYIRVVFTNLMLNFIQFFQIFFFRHLSVSLPSLYSSNNSIKIACWMLVIVNLICLLGHYAVSNGKYLPARRKCVTASDPTFLLNFSLSRQVYVF